MPRADQRRGTRLPLATDRSAMATRDRIALDCVLGLPPHPDLGEAAQRSRRTESARCLLGRHDTVGGATGDQSAALRGQRPRETLGPISFTRSRLKVPLDQVQFGSDLTYAPTL